MTEEEQIDPIAQMRDEFAQQFKELKDSFEAERKEKDELINQLQEQNKGLQRALVRSAVTEPPAEKVEEKTEEQIYQEEVQRLSKRTLEIMKGVM